MMRRFLPLFFLLLSIFPAAAQSPTQELALGNKALEAEKYEEAQNHYDRALGEAAGDPNIEASALHGRGVARLQLRQWSEADADLTRAIKLDPTDAGAFASRAMARKGLGDYNGLLLDAHEAARLNPTAFAQFEEDAKSTALFRRMMFVFVGLGCVVLCLGGYALVRVLVRITRAEREAKRANS